MKRIALVLALLCPVFAHGQEKTIFGAGSPNAQSPIPSCVFSKIYIDSTTGATWSSSGSPCGWVQVTEPAIMVACGTGDSTSLINSALANRGHIILGLQTGATACNISSWLVIPSNTWLDAGSTPITRSGTTSPPNTNLLINYDSTVSNRVLTDAAINVSISATTLTSASANFTSADLGSSIYVAGADYSGQTLCVTISAINSSTSVAISRAATTTVSGATATIYRRDSNITVTGGVWTFNTNGWGFFFQHIDGLTLRDSAIKVNTSNTGSQTITFGDATNVELDNVTSQYSAAGIAVRGPSDNLRFRNITGSTTDDLLALLGHETIGSNYDYARGPISNVLVDGLSQITFPAGTSGGAGSTALGPAVSMVGGNPACPLSNFIVRNITDPGSNYIVRVDSDTGIGGYTAISNLLIDGVFSNGSALIAVKLGATNGNDVTVKNVKFTTSNTAGGNPAVMLYNAWGSHTGSWTNVNIDGVLFNSATSANYAVYVAAGMAIGSLTARNVEQNTVGGYSPHINISGSGTSVAQFYWDSLTTSTANPIIPWSVGGGATLGGVSSPLLHSNSVQAGADLTQAVWALTGATTTAGVITVSSSGSNFVKQQIPASPGIYTFSFQAKAGTLTTPQYAVYDNTHSAFLVNPTSYASQINGSTWSTVAVPFSVPAGTTQISVYPMSNGTTTGTVNVTNVQVQ